MSYPNLPKSEYFQVFSAFRSCKASAFLHPQHQKSNKNLSLYRSKIFYRMDFWSIKAKTERILYGFAFTLNFFKNNFSSGFFQLATLGNFKIKFSFVFFYYVFNYLHTVATLWGTVCFFT